MTIQLVRYSPDVVGDGEASPAIAVTDYDVLPGAPMQTFTAAGHIHIDDPLSFPFEDVGRGFWDVPLLVRLPDIAFDDCVALLDHLLCRLTVCDQLAVPDALVERLIQHYGFGRSMFVDSERLPGVGDFEAARRAAELQDRLSTPYSEWPLPTVISKRRLREVNRLVRDAVAETPVADGRRPSVELHGWNVRRLVPAVWDGLTRVVERRPIALERLQLDYPGGRFERCGPTSSVRTSGCDVGVGVDHLRLSADHAVEQNLSLLFASVQVGGRLVLLETFDGGRRPTDFIDMLLEISTHRLTLHDVQMPAVEGDDVSTTGLFVMNKIGTWVES